MNFTRTAILCDYEIQHLELINTGERFIVWLRNYMSRAKAREPGDELPSHLAIRELRYLMRILGWGFPAARDPDSLEFQDSMQNLDKSLQARPNSAQI